MLLESALAEFSIDLNDNQQQMQDAAGAGAPNYTHRVVLEMCSPSESSCELVKNSGKRMSRHAGKEERQNASSRRNRHNRHNMIDLSEEEEYYNCYGASGCAPFRWELQPRVPRSPKIDGDLRDDEDHQAPLKLPPRAAAIISSPNSTTSSASIKNNGRYFSWNLSHLNRQSINVSEGSAQRRNSNDYDGDDDDDHQDKIELDSNEECSPVSTLELPGSPRSSSTLIPAANSSSPDRFTVSPSFYSHEASQSHVVARLRHSASSNSSPFCIDNSDNKATHAVADETNSFHNDKVELPSSPARNACTTLLWGVFPCSYSGKCLFVPSLKQKEKSKQPEWETGHQGKDSSVSSTSHCLKIMQPSHPHRPSALKKKSNRSSCCNRISGNSAVGSVKQVRFNVETGTANLPASSSSDEEGGTPPPPARTDSASYCLF